MSDALPEAMPVEGDTVSHDAVVLMLQFNCPLPALETFTVWTDFESPWVTEKAKLAGLTLIVEP
jgi:hypothetical protein